MSFRRGGLLTTAGENPAWRVPPERRGRMLRRIAAFFRPYRARVAVVLVAIIATSLLGLINPLLLKALIDVALPQRDWTLLNLFVGLMIVIPIVSGLIGVGQTYLNNVIGQHVMQDLRNALYTHLQRMPLRFFTETRTGEIQSRLANDVGGVQVVVTDTAASVTSNIAVATSTVIVMFLLDWRLTILSLGITPFFLYLTYRVGKVRRAVSSETQKSLADISAVTEETLSVSGILLSKTFGQQSASIDRFRGLNLTLAKLQIRQAMVGRWFFMIIGTVFAITPALVYWLAGYLAIQGSAGAPTIGDIVAFTTLQSRLFFPLGQLLSVQVEIAGALALFDRIFEYLDLDPEIVDAPDAVVLDPATVRGRVRLHDVSFRYPAQAIPSSRALEAAARGHTHRGEPATDDMALDSLEAARAGDEDVGTAMLGDGQAIEGAPEEAAMVLGSALEMEAEAGLAASDGMPLPDAAEGPAPRSSAGRFALERIDFVAEPGQLVALVGPSGSGKTTTTYLIPRLYDVDHGAVEVDGHDIRRVTMESLGRAIGFVTQETYLFHTTIRDNLLYARPEATEAEIETAARAAAIHERIVELPDGYATVVGERGYKLSGGEKQRIAIARVLLKDPRILILDEATSALDTVSERLIQSALESLMAGRTTIAIAHRLSTILRADLILVYERGRIVERGTHAELLRREGLYARLYREQFLGTGGEPVEAT
ncbi:MAG: ABC transporter transmembrane domain-containing protein [Chloroflexota bacterium]